MSFINDDALHLIKRILGESFILTERLERCDGTASLGQYELNGRALRLTCQRVPMHWCSLAPVQRSSLQVLV